MKGSNERIHVPEALRGARILMIDDEPANLRVLEKLLSRVGYEEVSTLADSRLARDRVRSFDPDLLLLDLHMPHVDGFGVMEEVALEVNADEYFPILVLTGDLDPELRQRALAAGATDFVTKPFDAVEVALRIRNLLETRHLHQELRHHNETLEERVRDRTRELAHAQVEILQRLALAAEYRDDVTGRHAERVGVLSALLGARVGMDERNVRLLRRAATLHDVGKIGIPDAILMKPGPLTPQEFQVMKSHTEIGARILSGSGFPLLRMARVIALHHHDRWDGKGYNEELAGEDIPLVGRVVALADVFDTLTHERPYKEATSIPDAVEIIRDERARHFDPQVVEAFAELVEEDGLRRLDGLAESSKLEDPPPLEGKGLWEREDDGWAGEASQASGLPLSRDLDRR